MKFKWQDWCRFCGSKAFTTKFEYSPEIIDIFRISGQQHKICAECIAYLSGFQEFLAKSRKVDELFNELSFENDLFLDTEKINEIRAKFDVDAIDFLESSEQNPNQDSPEPVLNQFSPETENFPLDFDDDYQELEVKLEESENSDSDPSYDPSSNSKKKPVKSREKIEEKKEVQEDSSQNLKCHICSFSSNNLNSLQKHCRKEHNCSPKKPKIPGFPLICNTCQEDFSIKGFTALINHCEKSHKSRPDIPCICGYLLNNYWTYYKHMKRCVKKFRATYECDLCGIFYDQKKQMDRHMDLRHKIDSVKNECKICFKSFLYPHSLRKHNRIHLPEDQRERKFHCLHCEKKFETKSALNIHTNRMHLLKSRNFLCHICSKSFKTKAACEVHEATIHAKSAEFVCDFPGCKTNKRFRSIDMLKNHKKTHAPINCYCPYCSRGFNQDRLRRNHIKNVHTHANVRPFKCNYCDLTFKGRFARNNHENGTHGAPDKFVCYWCECSFGKDSNRSRHYLKHHSAEYEEYKRKNNTRQGPKPEKIRSINQ